MNPVWLVPLFVLAVGGAAMVALLRSANESARELAAEVARFGELHGALARIRTELQTGSDAVRALRDR
jgi:hypothetical protein